MSTPDILNYQRDRSLDRVPGYGVGLQLRLAGGDRVYLAVSSTELVLYFHNDVALHFDFEARLVKIAEPNQYWRRSLAGRVVYSCKLTAEEGGGLRRVALLREEANTVLSEAHRGAAAVHEQLQTGQAGIEFGKPNRDEALAQIRPLLERAARFDSAEAERDAARFREIYGRVAILPPDEYNALVLQATQGCRYGACTYCQLYSGVPYRSRPAEEFERHIRDAVEYHGESLRARRSIFLGEANALTLPQNELLEDLALIAKTFDLAPASERHVAARWWLGSRTKFDGVASFLDIFTGTPRTADEFAELKRKGLRRVYIGMETGDDELLRWLHKPATTGVLTETVRTLKQAGITVWVIVLLGAGGKAFSESHIRETARAISGLGLERGDYVYFSPLVIYPGGPYDVHALEQNIEALNPAEMNAQEQAIRAALQFEAGHSRPYLAHYELELFTY